MADRKKEVTTGWSVVLDMIDRPSEGETVEGPMPPEVAAAVVKVKTTSSPPVEPRIDPERTVIDGRMADVLAVLQRDAETTDPPESPNSIEYADTTAKSPVTPERTRVDARIAIPDDFTEPLQSDAAELKLSDSFDVEKTLPPSVYVKPVSKETADLKPPRGPDAKNVKITVSDPKRTSGEVRVSPAGRSKSDARIAPSQRAQGRQTGLVVTPATPSSSPPGQSSSHPVVHLPKPVLDDPLLDAPPLPTHLLRELGPATHNRDAEMTVLDLAAQIGLAPEPAAPKAEEVTEDQSQDRVPAVSVSRPAPAPAKPLESPALSRPLDEQGAKVAEMLQEEAALPQVRGGPVPKMRGETLLEHLPRWLFITEGAAKIIPLIIAAFVVFSSVAVTLMLFRGAGGGGTEHVTLRFLPVLDANGNAIADPNLAPPMFTIETEPEGVLVVLDRKILGPTPLTFELPMKADRLGIELTSPYFETYVGQLVREATGEMRLHAKLQKKR